MGHQEHIETLFSTHPVLLERSRWDNSNHALKHHQTLF